MGLSFNTKGAGALIPYKPLYLESRVISSTTGRALTPAEEKFLVSIGFKIKHRKHNEREIKRFW